MENFNGLRCPNCDVALLWAGDRKIEKALISGEEVTLAKCMRCGYSLVLEQDPLWDDKFLNDLSF